MAVILLVALRNPAGAQAYRFRLLGIDEGLGNLSVTSVAQDAAGYIWVGTLNGLYRYDGQRFQRFGRTEGLAESQIVSVAAAPNGNLWAATTNGVALFRADRFVPVAFGKPVSLQGMSSLVVEPRTGVVWVATSAGLAAIAPPPGPPAGPRAHFLAEAPDVSFSAVGFGADGSRWSAGGRVLYHSTSGVIQRAGEDAGVPPDDWRAILCDGEGTIWVRSSTRLIALRRGATRFIDQTAGLAFAGSGSLGLESNGQVMVPTMQGLQRLVNGRWQTVGMKSGLPVNSVSTVFFDREGSPWIGTNGGGVARWIGFDRWEGWTAPGWLENDSAWSFAEDKTGQIWAGTDDGIVTVPRGSDRRGAVSVPRFHPKSAVLTLAIAPENQIWAGTAHHGVFRCAISRGTCESFGANSGLAADSINFLLLDGHAGLWVATESGLFRADTRSHPLRFHQQTLAKQPQGQVFRQIAEAPNGEIWAVGTSGVWRWKAQTWTHLTKADGLLDDDVAGIAMDGAGSLWISYERDLGVSHLRQQPHGRWSSEVVDQTTSLSSNYVYFLGVDARQRIWVGTDRGIDCRDGSTWTHFTGADGLIWPDLNTAGLFADSLGGMWFGTSHGIAHRMAGRAPLRDVPLVPIVTQAQVSGRTQDLTKPIAIPYRQNDITLHFSALSFLDETGIQYKYRIDGAPQEWRNTQDRDVHLLNLAPGTHAFDLMATRPRDVRSARASTLQLVVETPWWRTRVLWVFSSVAFLAILRGLWMWRMKGILRRQRELETAVTERTGDLLLEREHLLVAREAFAYQAIHDSLTDLANRKLLDTFLRDLLNQRQALSVLWIDLDRFKAVNDLFGHHAGDLLLQATADRLREETRSEDLVARIGGDEFVVVLTRGTEADACRLADRLVVRLTQPFEILNRIFSISASIGIALYPGHGDDPGLLLRNSDIAMYNAKNSGKSSYRVFAPEPPDESLELEAAGEQFTRVD